MCVINYLKGPYEKIALGYEAANRDPEFFDDSDKFNIMRSNAEKQLVFGIQRHACLSKPIALMQLREFFSQLFITISRLSINRELESCAKRFCTYNPRNTNTT